MKHGALALAVAAAALSGSTTAAPSEWTAILSNVPSAPTSVLPDGFGTLDTGTGTSDIDRPWLSSNGLWVITVFRDADSTIDELVLRGDGSAFSVVVAEGDPLPVGSGDVIGFIDPFLGINADGVITFATNTNGSPARDEFALMVDTAGTVSVVAREGDPVPTVPGAMWGPNLNSVNVLDDGRTGWIATDIDGLAAAEDSGVWFDGSFLIREGQAIDAGPDAYENFDADGFSIANSGDWTLSGDSNNTDANLGLDDFLVRNNMVVLGEGTVIPGSGLSEPIDASGIVSYRASHAGDWIARGNNADEHDWVVYNGVLVAATGDAVPGGMVGEVYDDAAFGDGFFAVAANGVGDFILGASTNNPDAERNAVLVHSSLGVLARENDPVDLDGNGSLDDNAFFDTFGTDDWVLTDDGIVYGSTRLRDATGSRIGQAFVFIQLTTACSPADLSSAFVPGMPDGVLSGADFFEFLSRFQAGDLSIDFSSPTIPGMADGTLTGSDFFFFLDLFAAGC